MPTTQLFVELLVIGFGAIAWLLLLVAAALGWQPAQFPLHLGGEVIVPLSALSYVLGILLDRGAREVFSRILTHPPAPAKDVSPDTAEHFICHKSEQLWTRCLYNRSRFRICRAWTLNFLLIAFAYCAWNARVGAQSWRDSAAIVALALLGFLFAAWATVFLNRDYHTEVGKVFRFLSDPHADLEQFRPRKKTHVENNEPFL
jgi:hypothetical protein